MHMPLLLLLFPYQEEVFPESVHNVGDVFLNLFQSLLQVDGVPSVVEEGLIDTSQLEFNLPIHIPDRCLSLGNCCKGSTQRSRC